MSSEQKDFLRSRAQAYTKTFSGIPAAAGVMKALQ